MRNGQHAFVNPRELVAMRNEILRGLPGFLDIRKPNHAVLYWFHGASHLIMSPETSTRQHGWVFFGKRITLGEGLY